MAKWDKPLGGKMICSNCGKQLNQHYTLINYCDGNSGRKFSRVPLPAPTTKQREE